jgi:hypothetical protein
MNGALKNEKASSEGSGKMKVTTLGRFSVTLAALGIAFLIPAPAHAQAEVAPDFYPINDIAAPAEPALASQPANVGVAVVPAATTRPAAESLSEAAAPSATLNAQGALRRMRTTTVAYMHRVMNLLMLSARMSSMNAVNRVRVNDAWIS